MEEVIFNHLYVQEKELLLRVALKIAEAIYYPEMLVFKKSETLRLSACTRISSNVIFLIAYTQDFICDLLVFYMHMKMYFFPFFGIYIFFFFCIQIINII